MADTITVQVNQRGVVTLPKTLREAYHIQAGDQLTLLDLGGVFVLSPRRSEIDRLDLGGVFVLSPRRSEIDRLADELRDSLERQGESLESMLQALREARQRYAA